MDIKYQQLKEQYDAIIDIICTHLKNTKESDMCYYLLANIMKIWSSNELYSSSYAKAVHVLTNELYTSEQIITAMNCCNDDSRDIMVPNFSSKLDKVTCQKVINMMGDFFSSAALINGDFTNEEAKTWNAIMDKIIDKCNFDSDFKLSFDPVSHITEKNEESYYERSDVNDAKDVTNQKDHSVVEEKNDEVNHKINELNNQLENLVNTLENAVNTDNKQETEAKEHVKKVEEKSMNELLEELNGLVGLDEVKKDVRSLMNFIKVTNVRKAKGMKTPTISYHLVFTGNPGTGKTTVARLIASLYYQMGILTKGQLVETDRSALVAGYLGQTAIKTQNVIKEALGGVLFIDEAYSLAGDKEDSYGKEAIETLLKAMEDHRDDLVVIVAGYDELMHKFIDSNPGLRSRFNKYFHFPDYNGEQLLKIFERFCYTNGYEINEDVSSLLLERCIQMYENREEHFGNARTMRNIFETAITAQADRIAMMESFNDDDLVKLSKEDIFIALEEELS